jgi:beta-lactamase superfamily II metal-dependent hydrolase
MPNTSKSVRVRAWNVRFGDCVLVSFDAGAGEKHILVDFGNAPSGVRGAGGKNDVFAPVASDIRKRTKGVIDLLIVSHEHLDHMEGFYSERKTFDGLQVKEVWMSIMSAPDYYQRFPKAEPEKRARFALLALADRWDSRGLFARLPESMRALVANNVLSLANRDRIDYLRKLSKKPRYLHRASRLASAGLGERAKIEVLAPEKDASVYYKSQDNRLWLDAAARLGQQAERARRSAPRRRVQAPSHMAADEFADLRDRIAELDLADLLAIDKAANNTSLVVRLTINGKVLLFPGDAEQESWSRMREHKLLHAVDFLKIAHHGSVNGMPFEDPDGVLNKLLKPRKKTIALVSTCRGVYGHTTETEIPHHRLITALASGCSKVYVTQDEAPFGEGFDITLS